MARTVKSTATVAVKGLDQFRRELRAVAEGGGSDGEALLKEANARVARFVIDKAVARASGVGLLQLRAAQSMVAGRRSARAVIIAWSGSVPYFFGAEFGAKQNVLRKERAKAGWAAPGRYLGYRQFEVWKKPGGGNTGYFLFPTMRAESANIVETYGNEIDRIMRKVFPD